MVKGLRRVVGEGGRAVRRGIAPQSLRSAMDACLNPNILEHAYVRASLALALQRRPRCLAVALRLRREAATYTSGVRARDRESGEGGSGRRREMTISRADKEDGSTHLGAMAFLRADLVTWATSGSKRGKGDHSSTIVAVGESGGDSIADPSRG